MKYLVLSFIIFHLSFSPVGAQTPWSLQQCCDYAVAHNIAIRQQQNRRDQQALQLSNAKNRRLPDLSGSAGQNFSFGRGLTAENTYTNTNTSSTSFSLGTSVPLFTGFQIPNNIKLNQLNLEAATQDLEKAKNDIRVQVAQAYVQILYDEELLGVARRQAGIDSAQVARLQTLLDNGKVSEAEVVQQKATLAQSLLTVTQADNNLQLAILALTQLLELDTPEGFSVLRPESEELRVESLEFSDSVECRVESVEFATAVVSPGGGVAPPPQTTTHPTLHSTPESLYTLNSTLDAALTARPEIQAEQLRLRATDHSLAIARAGYYPTLSFSAGLGTNYYTTSGFKSDPFDKQLKNNFSQYLGLNLSIPIFDRFQTRNNIKSAKIDRLNQQLALDNAKKSLYKEIQQAWYNTVAARQKVTSSREARHASETAFRMVQTKYENGKATSTEFNEAKNNYLKTESDLTQARYEYLYQVALLRFYRGEPFVF